MLRACCLVLLALQGCCALWGSKKGRASDVGDISKVDLGEYGDRVEQRVQDSLRLRLRKLFAKTKTDACRKKIADAVGDYMVSEIEEHGPWMNEKSLQLKHKFNNLCPKERPVKPRPTKTADEIAIFYLVMMHRDPAQTGRLIRALQHPNHHFVVHCDGKAAPELRARMTSFAAQHDNVRMISEARSLNVTWGGMGMVDVLSLGMQDAIDGMDQRAENFDFFIDISESSYPLKSDKFIRRALATYSPSGNFFGFSKMDTHANEWFSYVECDNKVHRVGKVQLPHGVDMQVGSQWVILTPGFMRYMLTDVKQVKPFNTYMRATRIPDESYLQTLAMISPWCHTVEKVDHTFINWDKNEPKTRKKCLMANPNHCGRSPVTLRIADLPLLQASNMFFARKFDADIGHSVELMNLLDELRARGGRNDEVPKRKSVDLDSKWHGSKDDSIVFDDISIVQVAGGGSGRSVEGVAAGTEQQTEMCLTIKGHGKNSLRMEKCQSGARQRFTVGPCWGDLEGDPKLRADGCIAGAKADQEAGLKVLLPPLGAHGRGNRRCSVKPYGVPGHCLDYAGHITSPGNPALVWDCQRSWNQLFVFRPGTCHLILEPPQEHDGGGKVPLCFQTMTATQKSSHWDGALEGKLCAEENLNQQFFFRDNTVTQAEEQQDDKASEL